MELGVHNIGAYRRGCAFLGAGGGGDIVAGLQARHAIEQYGPVELVAPGDLAPDALVMPCADMGAPTIFIEKVAGGHEGEILRREVERVCGRPVAALMPAAIGGSNGLTPVMWAARMRLPLVDADGMGRAFPELYMTSFELAGLPPGPAFLADERGNAAVLRPTDGQWMERLARALTIEFGGFAALALYAMRIDRLAEASVLGSPSLALAIGEALEAAADDPVQELCTHTGSVRLITGKVAEIERRLEQGFVMGTLVIEGTGEDSGRLVRLEFQNEFLAVLEQGEPLATVPDIISVVDPGTADAMSTERVRYGARCVAVAMPADPVWRTEAAMAIVGPQAFGYDFEHVPVRTGDAVGH